MLTHQEAHERVSRGMALLDEIKPGWEKDLERDVFDMSSSAHCVLGQTFYDYWQGVEEVEAIKAEFADDHDEWGDAQWPIQHGFQLDEGDDGWKVLERTWILALAPRLGWKLQTEDELAAEVLA